MNVFLAEDDFKQLNDVKKSIMSWAVKKKEGINIDAFDNLNYKLVNIMFKYNVAFLDIEMPSITGIEFAKAVRARNQDIFIVFITNHTQFAINGYDVSAFAFIIKPITFKDISSCMDKIYRIVCYNSNEILFIEACLHRSKTYTLSSVTQYNMSFSALNLLLDFPPFFNCHRSFTVNLNHIQSMRNLIITMDGDYDVPIAKKNVMRFKKSLFDLFEMTDT